MFFMLPHQNQTVDDVLGRITPQVLHQALWYMDELDVNVTIPKFKFDFSVQLSESLQKVRIVEKNLNIQLTEFFVLNGRLESEKFSLWTDPYPYWHVEKGQEIRLEYLRYCRRLESLLTRREAMPVWLEVDTLEILFEIFVLTINIVPGITLTNKVNTVPDGLQLFNANRPFAFFIEDEATGLCLFAGKVENPTQL